MSELNEVKKIRANLGMTQRQLAQALGVTERSVKSWASIAVNVCGIAVEVVGRALGHSVGQRVTLIYARLDTAQVDAAVVAVSRAVGEIKK